MTTGPQRVHLVGIGGMHMSAIGQLLLAAGVSVSGSDLTPSGLTERLEQLGARVHAGHAAEHVGEAQLVVATAAAKPDNPELIEARRRGIPVIPRHEMVARLMEGRMAIAIAGTHGKTTTSSLVAYVLRACGMDPTFLLGGESPDLGGNAAAGSGAHVVVEADEYAGAFLAYRPNFAVITNIEPDHLDYFGTEEAVVAAFGQFARNVSQTGCLIACADSPLLGGLLLASDNGVRCAVNWYGVDHEADWTVADVALRLPAGTSFTIEHRGKAKARVDLQLPGRHNVANALAAFAVGSAAGLDAGRMATALGEFKGVHRRFEVLGAAHGITVVDDYAHHPSEIRATLRAARERYPGHRIVALFQPHTYSRTSYLLDGFRCCFQDADDLYLLQTFAARETSDAGIDAHDLARELDLQPKTVFENAGEASERLPAALGPGDILLTLGAGNVTEVGRPVLKTLDSR